MVNLLDDNDLLDFDDENFVSDMEQLFPDKGILDVGNLSDEDTRESLLIQPEVTGRRRHRGWHQ
jgi:hypothetical protein